MTILVTGAQGYVGRAVLTELLASGTPVRASSRNPATADLPDGVDVVRADLTDPDTLPAALDGVRAVFLYAQSEGAPEFAAAARAAGVEHVALLSSYTVVMADADTNPIALHHAAVERALTDAGLETTFVRAGYFATNTLRWTTIRTERVLRTAFPDAVTAPVHERDIAGVAVRALLADTDRPAAPLVLGPGPLTTREQVATISEALGETVRLDEVDVETYRREQLTQLPEFLVERLISDHGTVAPLPEQRGVDATRDVLGRPPSTFAEWARDHAADFR